MVRLPQGAAPDSQNRIGNLLGTDLTDAPWIIEQSNCLSVRTPRWKYIEPNDGRPMITWGPKVETGYASLPQLYDMSSDTGETKNVALEHPDVVYDLQNVVRRTRARRGYTGSQTIGSTGHQPLFFPKRTE